MTWAECRHQETHGDGPQIVDAQAQAGRGQEFAQPCEIPERDFFDFRVGLAHGSRASNAISQRRTLPGFTVAEIGFSGCNLLQWSRGGKELWFPIPENPDFVTFAEPNGLRPKCPSGLARALGHGGESRNAKVVLIENEGFFCN
jgi:hypothetical protein